MQHTSLNHDKRAQITYLQKPKRTSSWRIIKNKVSQEKQKQWCPFWICQRGEREERKSKAALGIFKKLCFLGGAP
jgi:hypothetical protein